MPVKMKSRGRSSKGQTASELFSQAQLALQYDEVDEAIELMKKAVRLEPENAEVRAARPCSHARSCPHRSLISCRLMRRMGHFWLIQAIQRVRVLGLIHAHETHFPLHLHL